MGRQRRPRGRRQGHHHPGLREGRDQGPSANRCWWISGPNGAGRATAHPGAGEGRQGRQGQGQAGQDGHRQAPVYPRPARHPVDPGGVRLRQRPAGRRLPRRAAGEPGDRVHRARHQGPHRRRGKGRVEGGRHRARRGRRRRRRRPLRAGAGARRGNIAALAGLARAYLQTGAVEQAKQTLALVPEAKRNDAAVAAARAALELIEQAKSVGPVGELEQKVATNPLDHQARFDLAVALNSKGKRQEAVDQLWKSSSATANGTTTARASSWSSCSTPGARPTRRRLRGASGYPRSCFLTSRQLSILFVRS